MSAQAEDLTARNCEVFIDKIVPIKVYFHDRKTTYSKIEFYLKVRSDLAHQVNSANFYTRPTLYHAYGTSIQYWQNMALEKLAHDYYKLSLEVAASNHYVSKYSSRRDWEGNFNIKLTSGESIWVDFGGPNLKAGNGLFSTLGHAHYLNDGMYDLGSYTTTADSNSLPEYLNKYNCR